MNGLKLRWTDWAAAVLLVLALGAFAAAEASDDGSSGTTQSTAK